MKLVLSILFITIATVSGAKTYVGSVCLSSYPSLGEFARVYVESEEPEWRKVAAEMVESRDCASKDVKLANKAVVELQVLPGFKTIRKAPVVDGKSYEIEYGNGDPDCRVFCQLNIDGMKLSAAASPMSENDGRCFCQTLRLCSDHASVIGRCVDTNGTPIANARVSVDLVRTPVEVDEGWMHRPLFGRTDVKGYWHIDEIEKPLFYDTISRLCNTNVVNRTNSRVPPFGLEIFAGFEDGKSEMSGLVCVPNITAHDRAAAERIFAAYKRKTGKDWPRPAPMTDFPVSTNNVIYVPDIVLK